MLNRRGNSLPEPSSSFVVRKRKILEQLAVPDSEYTDASPKGTVDIGIRDLIGEINSVQGLVTTSSCAGRVSVFLEGRKASLAGGGDADDHSRQVAGVGGKGAGGTWLHVSHEAVHGPEWIEALSFTNPPQNAPPGQERRLIHFKFEPMILHVLTTSLIHAQLLLRAALQAGFRESGAINVTSQSDLSATPIVAIRSMGLGFESLIGYQPASSSLKHPLVSATYLQTLMNIANERFEENAKRIARFRSAFGEIVLEPRGVKLNPEGLEWEDAATRKERMKAEGLRRKVAMTAEAKQKPGVEESELDLCDTCLRC